MYKALLVDDENLVLKSLEAGIDWRKSGFAVAGKANNGAKALQLVRELKPHIVFTDIRMPGLSGLELIKRIKETDADVQIVVISGYAEFAYVQKSLSYGVLGYCLKPFDDHEIDSLLRTAAKAIEDIRLKRENELLELIEEPDGEQADAAFDRILRANGLDGDRLYALVSLGRGRLSFQEGVSAVSIHLGGLRTGYFVQCAEAERLRSLIRGPMPPDILGVGAAPAGRELRSAMKGLDEAAGNAWDFFVRGRDAIHLREEAPGETEAGRLVRQLERSAANKDTAAMRQMLAAMALPGNKRGMTIVHALIVYNLVSFHASSDLSAAPEEDYIFSRDQLYHLYRSFDAMIDSLLEELREPGPGSGGGAERKTAHANLKEIVKHINENYRKDISIQSIARSFYMNPNYLSQLFKRELNVTFTEYLTRTRLRQARLLLETTGLSIGEIAESVGFRDYFYFIRIFKKREKITPRQYRLQAGANREEKA
ncbi:response regulator transcription factor [Cohnella hongkongensis]|uniref:Response regulator n=1 Tax=Cohnella hongkongensis TaxID=178337 RepID=A0ABV9FDY8_9BACL